MSTRVVSSEDAEPVAAGAPAGARSLPVRCWNRSLPLPARRSTRQTRRATQP